MERNTVVGHELYWKGFAHSNLKEEEYEGLLRTLRFAMIQFNKFWVEISSFPVFMNELEGASIRDIERLLTWFQKSPRWSEMLTQARLIPEFKQPHVRAALEQFAEQVQRAAIVRQGMCALQETDLSGIDSLLAAQAHLGIALALVRQLGLERGKRSDVESRIATVGSRLARNRRLQGFFSRLDTDCGLPKAIHLADAGRLFQAADFIRRTQPAIFAWRKQQILGQNQKVRIEAWQDRARPMIEARKRLQASFQLEHPIDSQRLRTIASALRSGGAFRSFSASYKEALRQYQELPSQTQAKESVEVMAQKLEDWATYLDNRAAFENNAEARGFFSPAFRGIDTDFAGALAAHAWAMGLRAELKVEDPTDPLAAHDVAFCSKILDWAFNAPELKLHAAVALCTGEEARAVQAILLENEYAGGREFSALEHEDNTRLLEATRLRESLVALGFKKEIPLIGLADLRALLEDRLSLVKKMNAREDVKTALKNLYAGEDTDLAPLETAKAYVDFIEGARLPEALRNSFLTAYGPGRLNDTRALVAPAQNGLAAVQDHLGRLLIATDGQSAGIENESLLGLINRIQRTLKHPQLLSEWVQRLRFSGRA